MVGLLYMNLKKPMDDNSFVAIESQSDLEITQVEISGLKRESILSELNRCSINEQFIYPDLAGLCSHLNYVLVDKVKAENERIVDAKRESERLKYASEYYNQFK
ncbi:hypothetical protein [Photobacterium damselae]|nr:hypothetical protein [Photobacterium damselae]MDP2567308.1 hypothetical protein [Photobacterium damselae subsp. piscicida]PSW71763.1 hypothetical protein CTT37_19455 [Photobacterium damselae]